MIEQIENNTSFSPLDLKRWTPFRMFRVAEAMGSILAEYYGPDFGLKRHEWRALAVIANHPEATAREISELGDMDPFTASRAIQQLSRLGYVIRGQKASDKRQASLTLLPRGEEVVGRISSLARSLEAALLTEFSETEQRTLGEFLRRMEDATAVLRARDRHDLLMEEVPDNAS